MNLECLWSVAYTCAKGTERMSCRVNRVVSLCLHRTVIQRSLTAGHDTLSPFLATGLAGRRRWQQYMASNHVLSLPLDDCSNTSNIRGSSSLASLCRASALFALTSISPDSARLPPSPGVRHLDRAGSRDRSLVPFGPGRGVLRRRARSARVQRRPVGALPGLQRCASLRVAVVAVAVAAAPFAIDDPKRLFSSDAFYTLRLDREKHLPSAATV